MGVMTEAMRKRQTVHRRRQSLEALLLLVDEAKPCSPLAARPVQKNIKQNNHENQTGFILHRIGDDYIIMQDGSSNVDFSKVISLNQTSAMLWQEIENKEFDTDSVTEALTSRYDVDNESARRDARSLSTPLTAKES